MPTLPDAYTLEAFPQDGRFWRLDWFGQFNLNPAVGSEPTIEVVLVPLRGRVINPATVNKKTVYDYPSKRIVRVGTGLLPCLHIGTFWQNGKQSPTPAYTEMVFPDLFVGDGTSRISDADADPYLLLTYWHPSVENFPTAKFLLINRNDIDSADESSLIIIPCVEIVRFYYANSTQLAREIITGGLDRGANTVYDPLYTGCGDDGIGYLQLRRTIKNADAGIVARIAFSDIANRRARQIYHSIIKNGHNHGCFVLEVQPPFDGTTTLKVQGKWIKPADTWHFLVYWIESCTAPFPFTELYYARDNDNWSDRGPEEGKLEGWRGARRRPNQPTERADRERLIRHDDEPSLDLVITDVELDSNRFPDLKDKKIRRQVKQESHYRAGRFREDQPSPSAGFSTGAGTHGRSDLSPLSINCDDGSANKEMESQTKVRKTALSSSMPLFRAILAELARLGGFRCEMRQLDFDGDFPLTEGVSYFPATWGGKPLKWSYIHWKHKQRRQVAIAEIRCDWRYFYLIDIEVRNDAKHDRYAMLLLRENQYRKLGEEILKADSLRRTASRTLDARLGMGPSDSEVVQA